MLIPAPLPDGFCESRVSTIGMVRPASKHGRLNTYTGARLWPDSGAKRVESNPRLALTTEPAQLAPIYRFSWHAQRNSRINLILANAAIFQIAEPSFMNRPDEIAPQSLIDLTCASRNPLPDS